MSQFTRLGAVTMDDEIAALLNSVQQKAMQINDESLRYAEAFLKAWLAYLFFSQKNYCRRGHS